MSSHLLRPGIVTLAVLGLAGCGADTTEPTPPATRAPTTPELAVTSNTWRTQRDMPLDLVSQATAVVPNAAGQSILYAIAGSKAQTIPIVPMGEVLAYNVATNTWTHKQDMPVARYGMNGAGVINGKIYVTGGFTSKRQPSASVFVYNPASNTWTQKRNMPAPGGGGVTGVIGGKLYVVTFGPGLPDTLADFFRYDPTTDSWTKLPSPSKYSALDVGGGVLYEKLYLIGPRVLVYDPVTNQWAKKGSFGSGLEGRTVNMLAHLYVFGDSLNIGGVPFPGIFIYDPLSDTWETKPLLTKFDWNGPGALAATRIFLNGQPRVEVIGGLRGLISGSPGTNQQYIP